MSEAFVARFHAAVREAGPSGISSADLLRTLFPGRTDEDGALIHKVRRQAHWLNRAGHDVRSITRYHLVAGPPKEGRPYSLQSRLLAILKTGPMTEEEIASALGCRTNSVFNALRKMRFDGAVVEGRTVYVDMSADAPEPSPRVAPAGQVDLRASLRVSIAKVEGEIAERRVKLEAMRSLLTIMGAPE